MRDLIVIGAGPGGSELALLAKSAKLDVLLIEENLLGGTCLNEGCIPTKALLHSGASLKEEGSLSAFLTAQQQKLSTVENLRKGLEYSLTIKNVEVVYGRASFVDQTTIRVNETTYQAKTIVIASGSSIRIPKIPGLTQKDVYTSRSILEIQEVPEHLVIIGGGIIGLEMASIFADFNAKVTVIEAEPTILPSLDKELVKRLQMHLKAKGMVFYTNQTVAAIKSSPLGKEVWVQNGETTSVIACSHILVATGRKANIEHLQVENAGLELSNNGIKVDEHFQTNVPHIYAIGDCNGKWMLAHAASSSAKHVFRHMLNKSSQIRFDLMPNCLYTHLQLAQVGKMEADQVNDERVRTLKYPLRANAMAQATNQTEGMIKLVIENNRLVGVAILHEQASTLIGVATEMIASNKTLEELDQTIVAHPTIVESLYEAVHQALNK